jgi:hypothetical protein
MDVGSRDGHRFFEHSGEVGGFVAENAIYPDDKIAIVVLTNEEASSAAGAIARAVSPLLLATTGAAKPSSDAATAAAEAQAKAILNGLEAGKLDRSLFTDDCNFYFSQQAIGDFQTSLTPLGSVTSVTQRVQELRGGMTFRVFTVQFSNRTLRLVTYTMQDGKLEQFLVGP